MNEEPSPKLIVLLHADVVGSTRLVQRSEGLAHKRIQSAFRRFSEIISSHGGVTHEIRGDALVAEFTKASDAISSAVAFQAANTAHNEGLADDVLPVVRIGIAMGEVVVADRTLTGEGVVLAQRLEQLAEPGGVCIQGAVYETVPKRLPFEYEDLGKRELKGFKEPINAFSVSQSRRVEKTGPNRTDPQKRAAIAILPFANMSGDPEQEYFSDGITEDVITALSRFQNLTVIARNSTFTYKGKSVKSQEIGQDLGVQYIVEGSVRKVGDRIRVSVQLIDADTGNHIWAERYDRNLVDIFELQDELTRTIVATLPGRIEYSNVQRIKRSLPGDLGIYDRLLHAKVLHHSGSREDNEKARNLLDEAIEISPEFASAYFWKSCCVSQGVVRGYMEEYEDVWTDCLEWTRKGYSIDENDFEVLWGLCEWHMALGEWDQAELVQEKAFNLNPNDPRIVAQRGELLTWLGQPEEAVGWIEKVMQLDPYNADNWAHLLGQALFGARRYEEAVRAFMRVPTPSYGHHAYMAACYANLGLDDKANTLMAKTLEKKSDFSAKQYVTSALFPPLYQKEEDVAHLLNGLRKAGLPE